MAEGVISDLAAKALEALGKAAFKEAASLWSARNDLKKLEKTIKLIQARVCDAERHQEKDGSDTVKEWLRRLRMVLYQVDDLFDLVLTVDCQKQRIEVDKQVCVSFSRSGSLYFNWKISREIKSIRQQLDEINSDIAGLNLNAYHDHRDEPQPLRARFVKNRETGSFVKAKDVIGRETDRNIIIGMLFDSNNDGKRIAVIPIVGFGGLGKTTLAQLVYNDEGVRNHFDLAAWVCVPEIDDQNQVLRKVCLSLSNDKDTSELSVDQIKSSIQQSLKDKKYLLVLDDIWDESRDRWLDLLSLLECGASGSRVIVTTRSANVAKAVGTTEAHNLGFLTQEESWNLFKIFAFRLGQEESNPVLIQLGKEIVESCGNVPLAIRVVGSLLHSENSEKHWQQIRNARFSKAKRNADNSIMQVLKLSYDYLPMAVKQCFAYCSLFEKDYTYRKDELIKLWMAQGYFAPSSADTGEQYFLELLGRNLFQDPNEDDEGNVICFKMHDLVHDLAQDIAGEEMKQVEPLDQISFTDGLMHVSFETKEPQDGWEAPVSLLAARKMRSLILPRFRYSCTIKASYLKMVILKFQSLRVLDLEGMNISVVPNSVGRLRHLRYLNLARNYDIKCLPDDITRLQNLQTLKLVHCRSLTELPRHFCKLDNLRHLEIACSGLTDFPLGLGKMKSLKELDEFVVGKSYGIDSLPPLNFCEILCIRVRKWRSDAVVEAQRANLKDYQRLSSLSLSFGREINPNLSEMDKMLMFLQLPPNLKAIRVQYYEGVEMPRRWLEGLSKLVSIHIQYCSNCRVLPHLSRLPYLNDLCLDSFDDLEYVEDEDDIWVSSGGGKCGSGAQNGYFPSLTTLQFLGLRSLKGWTRPTTNDDGEPRQLLFPRLRRMRLSNCPKLTSMPLAPKLESLSVKVINWKVLAWNLMSIDDEKASSSSLSSSTLSTSLKEVIIDSIEDGLAYPTISSKLSNLERLTIDGCKELTSLTIESSNSIQHLGILDCTSLENITVGNLFVLKTLYISRLKKLTQLPEETGNLSLLCQLNIVECPELTSLPQSLLGLTSLQELYIRNCPHLKERYKKPNGQDWHLLQHIPKVSIR